MEIDKIKEFLSTRPQLTAYGLEQESKLSDGTLFKALKGERGLSKNAYEKLLPVLKKYGYTYLAKYE